MQENKKRRNAKSKYSPAVVRAVLYDVQTSSQTLAQIAAKNGLPKGSGSMISKWVKKYSSDFSAMEDLQPNISKTNPVSRLGRVITKTSYKNNWKQPGAKSFAWKL